MIARDVIRRLLKLGCRQVRQRGSHARFVSPTGECAVTVPVHAGRDLAPKTLRSIEKAMEPCLGPRWLSR